MRSTATSGVFSNPVLVGAVTVLVAVVAVFLSYNANQGLPFVPTQQLNIELPNGANLITGNEVREGGYRIGQVTEMEPIRLGNGTVGAVATLDIDMDYGDIPVDTRYAIRPRSVLGLKYVELQRGSETETLESGATLTFDRAHIPVEIDEFFGIFDEPTREGSRKNMQGFGDALAQRGPSINRTIEEAPRLLRHLEPVMRMLARDDTRLARFFGELNDFTRTVAPVADRWANSFEAGADTFEAWSRYPDELGQTIERSVPTLDVSIESLRAQRPFLREFAGFSRELNAVAQTLPGTLPRIIPALQTGVPVLRRSPEINRRLGDVMVALEDFSENPGTGRALRGLTKTTHTLNPAIRFLGPYITVCNYFNYSWTHVAEHLTEPDPTGGSQRTLLNQASAQIDPEREENTAVNRLGAPFPANGGVTTGTPQHLHGNLYTAAVTEDGRADCESGQRGYVRRQAHYHPENLEIVVDPHLPGAQGTTFSGRPRVPRGQTWDRHPRIGPRMPPELRDP
jgi:virulence factor Mce-like protein